MFTRARCLAAAWVVLLAAALAQRPAQGQDVPLKAGDRAVTTERVAIQAAQGTVATLEAGAEVTVVDVRQGWVGISAQHDGKKVAGWVPPKSLARAPEKAGGQSTEQPAAAEPDSDAFRRGYAAHVRGELIRAITEYTEAIRLDPKNARAYNNRGLVYQAKGDLNRAIADFSEALQLTPAAGTIYTNRGAAYARKGNLEKALADYNEAIRLDPQSADAYRLRAAVYEATKEKDKAAADLLQASRLYRPKYDTIAHKAIKLELEVKKKDYLPNYALVDAVIDEARTRIKTKSSYTEEEATEVLKTIDDILLQKRFIQVGQGLVCDGLTPRKVTPKMQAALDPRQMRFRPRSGETVYFTYSFTNALLYAAIGETLRLPIRLVLAPGHVFVRWVVDDDVYINWETTNGVVTTASEYMAWKHVSEPAIKNGVYFVPLSPDEIRAYVHLNLGLVWGGVWPGLENEYLNKSEATRSAKAIDNLTKAIELNKRLCEAYTQRGRCWSILKDYDKAIADDTTALQLDPEQTAAYFGRGVAYFARGDDKKSLDDVRKSIPDFDRVIDLNPQAPTGFYFRGLARTRTRELDKALSDLTKAIELEPRFVPAYEARAKLWEALGKGEQAKADLSKARMLQEKR